MEYLYERVAYLRGLVEGLGIENSTKEGKVITNIIDVLSDFADAINELNESQEELDEYVYLDEEVLDKGEEVLCPNCHEPIEIDMDCCHHDCCCDE